MNATADILKKNIDRMEGHRIECSFCEELIKANDHFKACPSPNDSESGRLVFYHVYCFERIFGKGSLRRLENVE